MDLFVVTVPCVREDRHKARRPGLARFRELHPYSFGLHVGVLPVTRAELKGFYEHLFGGQP